MNKIISPEKEEIKSKHKKNKQEGIPPILERYELKYTIPLQMVDEICDFISPYCSLDKYSEIAPDLYYTINSLYFDTPDYLLLRLKLQEADNRFNIRVRTYGEKPSLPWFLEIKHKRKDIIKKYRAKIYTQNLEQLLITPEAFPCPTKDEKEEKNKLLFYRLVQTYNLSPKVLIQYKRKAYISEYDEYARVTFDIRLRAMLQNDYNPVPDEKLLQDCDIETIFDKDCCVILELKCYTSYVPLWMIDLIKKFQLQRRGFSKYLTGMRLATLNYSHFNPTIKAMLYDDIYEEEEE